MSDAVDHVLSKVPRMLREAAEEQRQGRALLRRIEPLSPGQREIFLANRRTLGPTVVDGLLDRAREAVRDDPCAAMVLVRLAALALTKVTGLPADTRSDLLLRVVAERANALRVVGDLRGAAVLWSRIDGWGRTPLDPLDAARLASLRASYEDWVRRPTAAINFLRRAIGLYRRHDDRRGLATSLAKLSAVYLHAGESERALRRAVDALSILTARDEVAIRLVAIHNLAAAAIELGDERIAETALRSTGHLYTSAGSEVWCLRRRWLEARLCVLRRELPLAAGRLDDLAADFRRRDMPYEVAVVGLERLEVDALRGRWREVSRRAAVLVHAFGAISVEREALASLIALKQARDAQITLDMVTSCVRSLRRTARPAGGSRGDAA